MRYFKSNILRALLPLVLIATIHAAWASSGGKEGGGDGYIILKDDSIVLADPFVARFGSDFDLSSELKDELKHAGRLLVQYGAAYVSRFSLNDYRDSAFIQKHVLNPLVEYRFVSKLPQNQACQTQYTVEGLPDGARDAGGIACTQGMITWILKTPFLQMTLRQQAMLIIHERLHSLSYLVPHEFIADILQGLNAVLDIYNEEAGGGRAILSDAQVSAISTMMERIWQAGLGDGNFAAAEAFLESMKVQKFCGGLVNRRSASIGPQVCLGAGAQLQDGHITGPVLVLSSDLAGRINVRGNGVIIRDSMVIGAPPASGNRRASLNLDTGVLISHSYLFYTGQVDSYVGANARITHSVLEGADADGLNYEAVFSWDNWALNIGAGATIANTTLVNGTFGDAQVDDGINFIGLKLGANALLVNLSHGWFFGEEKFELFSSNEHPQIEIPAATTIDGLYRYMDRMMEVKGNVTIYNANRIKE